MRRPANGLVKGHRWAARLWTVVKKENWPELVALTSIFSVELPGIEDAYSAVELRFQFMSQHGVTWRNVNGHGNVLTTVSTPCRIEARPHLPPKRAVAAPAVHMGFEIVVAGRGDASQA